MLNGQGIEGFESSRRSRFGEPGMATPACAAPERDRLEAAGYRDRARCDGRCGEPMDVGGARWWRGSIAFAHDARPSFQIDAGAETLDCRPLSGRSARSKPWTCKCVRYSTGMPS